MLIIKYCNFGMIFVWGKGSTCLTSEVDCIQLLFRAIINLITMEIFTKIKSLSITLLILSITLSSCRQVAYIDGKAIIGGRTFDSTLKDSAMIYGLVCYAPDEKAVIPNANIWIEELNIKTLSNDTGFFRMKIPSGKYTIKCYRDDPNEEFVNILKDLTISPDEKVEIKFFRGSMAE